MSAAKALLARLESENLFLRKELERLRADPGDIPFLACDNSCVVCRPGGMATNGGCRCDERKLRAAVCWWRMRAQSLQATIAYLRDGDGGDAADRAGAPVSVVPSYRGSCVVSSAQAMLTVDHRTEAMRDCDEEFREWVQSRLGGHYVLPTPPPRPVPGSGRAWRS